MKHGILIFLSMFALFALKGQNTYLETSVVLNDTTFLNKKWNKCERKSAKYFRLIYKREHDYLVKDFYISGVLQMEAECSELYPLLKNGKCVYYYNNGQKQQEGVYRDNKPIEVWSYWSKNGKTHEVFDLSIPKEPFFDSISWLPQNQSSLFVGNINYRYKLNTNPLNSGHGLGLEGGFNIGYYYSQKLLLAPFVGIAMRDFLWNTSYRYDYIDDFNKNFNGNALSGNDSLVAFKMKEFINGTGYFHDLAAYYGIMIKLPFRYAPVVKIYRGTYTSAYKTFAEVLYLQPSSGSNQRYDRDYFDISKKLEWGAELFLYSGRSRVSDYDPETHPRWKKKKFRRNTHILALSIYAEQIDSYHATFDYTDGNHDVSVPMEKFMTPSFMQKYKKEYNFGVRLSCGAY